MSQHWMRTWSMQIGDIQMDPELRIKFHSTSLVHDNPAVLVATILNVERSKAASVKNQMNKVVTLNAGYQDNSGLIFKGEVYGVQTLGRETPVDTYVRIEAQNSDENYNHAYTSATLKAGSTGKDVLDTLMKSYKGVNIGSIPTQLLQQLKYPRSRMLYGPTSMLLRELSRSVGATHYIDQFMQLNMRTIDGKPNSGSADSGVRDLNSNNGLLGMPVQTELGVIARCNMDPSWRIGDNVHIDQSLIREAVPLTPTPRGSINPSQTVVMPPTSADGNYTIIAIANDGDSRGMGMDWWTELTCYNASAAPSQGQMSQFPAIPSQGGQQSGSQ